MQPHPWLRAAEAEIGAAAHAFAPEQTRPTAIFPIQDEALAQTQIAPGEAVRRDAADQFGVANILGNSRSTQTVRSASRYGAYCWRIGGVPFAVSLEAALTVHS